MKWATKILNRMEDFPAILFPHSYLPESNLKRVLSLFVPVTIFQPWFMERPLLVSDAEKAGAIRIVQPPDHLKPDEDFKTRLSAYRHWMENNMDRGYTDFLVTSRDSDLSEGTTWEIRQMIRRMGGQTSRLQEDPSLKWHLILHLAQEVEDQRREADRLLRSLREKDAPLKGVVEESDDLEGLVEDLPPFEADPIGNEHHLRQIVQAWFGLFGRYLKGNEILVTTDFHIMDYVTEIWRESRSGDRIEDPPSVRFAFPDLSLYPLEDLAEIKKTLLNNERIRELKLLVRDFGKNATRSICRMKTLSKEVEAVCSKELSAGLLDITVKYMPPLRNDEQRKSNEVLKHFVDRTFILVEA